MPGYSKNICTLTMEVIGRFLECVHCNRISRQLKLLTCLHSVCEPCMTNFVQNDILRCPRCQLQQTTCVQMRQSASANNEKLQKLVDFLLNEGNVHRRCNNHSNNVNDVTQYCRTCQISVCNECLANGDHSQCTRFSISNLNNVFKENLDLLLFGMKNKREQLSKLHSDLLPKKRKFALQREETSIGISKYFSDLRFKFEEYLISQERNIQHQLDELVGKECNILQSDVELCSGMLDSFEEKYCIINTLPREYGNDEELLKLIISIQYVNDIFKIYDDAMDKLQTASHELPNVRFIINTEFEDSLENTSIIKVEIVHPRAEQTNVNRRPNLFENHTLPQRENGETAVESGMRQYDDHFMLHNQSSQHQTDVAESSLRSPSMEQTLSTENVTVDVSETPPPPYPGLSNSLPSRIRRLRIPSNRGNCQISSASNTLDRMNRTESLPRPLPSAPPPPFDRLADLAATGNASEIVQQTAGSNVLSLQGNSQISLHSKVRFLSFGDQDLAPNIMGMVFMDKDTLLVLDKKNKSLKFFDWQSRSRLKCLRFGNHSPWDIAKISETTVVVAFPEIRNLTFIYHDSIETKKLKSHTYEKPYTCVAFNDSTKELVCSCNLQFSTPCIDILDENFRLKLTLNPGSGTNLISYPRAIVADGEWILVSDYSLQCVRSINRFTTEHRDYKGTRFKKVTEPYGLARLQSDVLFTVSTNSQDVHVMDKMGNSRVVLEGVLNTSPYPGCLATFHDDISVIAVAFRNGSVEVFEVEM